MEEREAGLDLQKKKMKVKAEGSPLEASDSDGLKPNRSEVRRSPYFQKTEKKLMVVAEDEEEGEEKVKPRSQSLANLEELLSRFAFKGSCENFRRNVGLGPSNLRKPAFQNTPKTMSPSRVRKVSPYFQNTPKTMSPSPRARKVSRYFQNTPKTMSHSQVRKISPYFQNSTAPQLKPFPKGNKKVSPYFKNSTARQLKPSTKGNKKVSPYFSRQGKIAGTRRPLKK